jgi:hypothetical protein
LNPLCKKRAPSTVSACMLVEILLESEYMIYFIFCH